MAMTPAQSAAHEQAFYSGDWSAYNAQYPSSSAPVAQSSQSFRDAAFGALPAATPVSSTGSSTPLYRSAAEALRASGQAVPTATQSSQPAPRYTTAASALQASGVNIPAAAPSSQPAAPPTAPPAAPPPGGTTGGFGAGSSLPPAGGGTSPPPTNTNATGYSQTNFNPALSYQPWYYTPREGTASSYNAQQLQVTPDMMVNERVAELMRSPVGLMAMDVAREYMNSRGMMDSTAAIQAITRAAIQAGLPIAEKDAATYFQAANENLAAENLAREYAAEQRNTFEALNMGAYNTAEQAQMQAYNRSREFGIETSFNDYWNRMRQAEEGRQFDANNALQRLQLDVQYAQTANQVSNSKMAFILELSGANLQPEVLGRVLNTAVASGLFSQYEADVIFANMPSTITQPGEVG